MPRVEIRVGLALCLALLTACTQSVETIPEPGAGEREIPIIVHRPEGEGPFPAIVLMHHCGGIRSVTVDWRKRLVAWGYVVAVPDSFTTRGYTKGVCGDGTKVTGATRAVDAFMALHLLEQRPDVLPDRIGLVGHSHGGVAVLATASNAGRAVAQLRTKAKGEFRAAVAFYPWCGDSGPSSYGNGTTFRNDVPLLILAGDKDDWTPSGPCQEMAADAQRAGQPVEITVYPGAYHAFDGYTPLTRVPEARLGKGATIGGSPAAREASIQATREFLSKYLPGARAP